MLKKTNVVLIYGGKSGEHEVSLISAASVLANLNPEKYHIIPIGMDKDGCAYLNNYDELLSLAKQEKQLSPEDAIKEDQQERSQAPAGLLVCTPNSKRLPSLLVNGKLAIDADVVFPVVHGPLHEDGCLQGLLKLAGVPFVGSDVLSSALGMDKDIARRLVCADGLVHCAQYRTLSWHSTSAERQQFCQEVEVALGWPLFVKPCSLGSSVGIHKAKNRDELAAAIEDALRYDETILVEEFIEGREIELAVLENIKPGSRPRVSVPGEIRVHHVDGFYSYAAKYLESDVTELIAPALLNAELVGQLQTMASSIFTQLKCKGMARVDFFVNEQTGVAYFNEINTLPGFTPISMYPRLWQVSGLDYPDLLDELIHIAMIHDGCRRNLVTNYQ